MVLYRRNKIFQSENSIIDIVEDMQIKSNFQIEISF
jgi:hypothetical protein